MPNMAWNLTKLTWNLTIVINTRLEITKALESDVGCRVWHSKERGLSIYLLIGSMSKICHLSNHRIKFQQFGFITNDRKGKWLEHFILPTWNILFHSLNIFLDWSIVNTTDFYIAYFEHSISLLDHFYHDARILQIWQNLPRKLSTER